MRRNISHSTANSAKPITRILLACVAKIPHDSLAFMHHSAPNNTLMGISWIGLGSFCGNHFLMAVVRNCGEPLMLICVLECALRFVKGQLPPKGGKYDGTKVSLAIMFDDDRTCNCNSRWVKIRFSSAVARTAAQL
jgi:hypothetical protein